MIIEEKMKARKYKYILLVVCILLVILFMSIKWNSNGNLFIYEDNNIIETNEIVYFIDSIEQKDNELIIIGWSYLKDVESVGQKVYIEITDEKSNSNKFYTKKISTPELVDYFNNKKYSEIRFSAKIPLKYINIAEEYDIKIIMENNEELYKGDREYKYTYSEKDNMIRILVLALKTLGVVLSGVAIWLAKERNIKFNKVSTNTIDAVFLMIFTICFFSLMPILTFDSMWYHSYLDIFNGLKPITEWDPTRGVIFPLLIFLSTKLFGYTTQGITITMYIFYIVMVIVTFKFIKLLGISVYNNNRRVIAWIVLTVFLFLNPVVMGYYHLVLTEFLAATLITAFMYLLYNSHQKMAYIRGKQELSKLYTVRIVQIVVFTSISFFVKQMYAAPIILLFLGSEIVLFIRKACIHRILVVVGTIALSIGSIISTDSIWNKIINIDEATNILGKPVSNSSMLTSRLKYGARYFRPQEETKIVTEDGYSVLVNVMEGDKVKESFIYEGTKEGILDSSEYLLNCLVKNPFKLLEGYVDNYMLTANIYRFKGTVSSIAYHDIDKKFSLTYSYENSINGMYNKNVKMGTMVYNNFFDEYYVIKHGEQYNQLFDTSGVSKLIHNKKYIVFSNFIYSTLALLALPIMVISLIYIIKNNDYFNEHAIIFITSFTLFWYISSMSFMGIPLDRYVFPLYSLCVLIIILYSKMCFKYVIGKLKQ